MMTYMIAILGSSGPNLLEHTVGWFWVVAEKINENKITAGSLTDANELATPRQTRNFVRSNGLV